MERKDLLKLARVMTRLVRAQGRPAGYLRTVDLLTPIATEARGASREVALEADAASAARAGMQVPSGLLRRALRAMSEVTGVTLDPVATLTALTEPERSAPLVRWPEGPPAGVYLTTSPKAALAAIARYMGATHAAVSFTDWTRLVGPRTVDLQPSQDLSRFYAGDRRAHPEPSGIFRARLVSEPSGTLIITGPIPFSAHEGFASAEKLHEACWLASECGHRMVAVVRTPRPQELARDLLQAMDIPEYYDLDYVRSGLRGTLANDGRLVVGAPVPADLPQEKESTSPQKGPQQRAPQTVFEHSPPARVLRPVRSAKLALLARGTTRTESSSAGVTTPDGPLIIPPNHQNGLEGSVPWTSFLSEEAAFAIHTRAWRETALAISAASLYQRTPVGPLEAGGVGGTLPHSAPELPKALSTLLARGTARRDTGLLLLGGRQESFERVLLLSEALAVTQAAGPAAVVLAAYQYGYARRYLRFDEGNDGSELVCSRCFPHLPLYSCVQSAYASGYRRIVIEYDCPPYPPVAQEVLDRYSGEVCFILCVNGIDARHAFEWATQGDWNDLENLIGVLTWDQLSGAGGPMAICDAFVPGDPSVNGSRYVSASEAMHTCRQLKWEAQALHQLDSHAVEPAQLRERLLSWGAIDVEDAEAVRQTERIEGLRLCLFEHLLARRRPRDAQMFSIARQYH